MSAFWNDRTGFASLGVLWTRQYQTAACAPWLVTVGGGAAWTPQRRAVIDDFGNLVGVGEWVA